jgi:hypothetical protein
MINFLTGQGGFAYSGLGIRLCDKILLANLIASTPKDPPP